MFRLMFDRFGTLPWGYFCLMGLGLLLASFFLFTEKLSGGEWVAICSLLFSTDRIASGIADGLHR